MSVLVFFIIFFISFFVFIPFKLKAKISYNILKNKGQLKLYFFKWNFLTLKAKVKKGYLYFTTNDNFQTLTLYEYNEPVATLTLQS